MNKKLMAAAVAGALAIPAVAFAQSSVTLYGTIDTGIRNQSKVIDTSTTPASDGTVTSMTDGLYRTNRWGMKGSEDLGGGLKANFKLEGQYSSDTGAGPSGGATFARSSWVGLSSGGMEFHLGRDYTVNFKTWGKYDPMGYNFTGMTPNVRFTAGVRSSNMIQASANFDGGGVMVDYALGEAIGSTSKGARYGIGGHFNVSGVTVAAAYSTAKDGAGNGNQKDTTIGASYAMNQFTFKLGYAQTKWDSNWSGALNGGGANGGWYAPSATGQLDKARMIALGVGYAFSDRVVGRIGYYDIKSTGFAAADDGKSKDTVLAVDYHLSKRTTAYVEVDHTAMDGSAVGTPVDGRKSNDGTTGLGVGIAHTF
jgi:predicted porin